MAFVLWLAGAADYIVVRDPLMAGLLGWLVGYAICPAYMYLLAVVSEWRWPKYHDQFKAFMPGNIFLGVVFGSSCYLAASYLQSRGLDGLSTAALWVWAPFAVAVVLVLALSILDVIPTFSYREGDTNKYHWRQLVSWTKIWHNVGVYGIYGYLLVRIGVPGLLFAPWSSWPETLARLLLLVCLVRWVWYLKVDTDHPKHATGHVRVTLPQWLVGLAVVTATLVGVAYALPV